MGRQKSTARRSCAAVLLPGIDDDIEQLLPPVVLGKRERPADTASEPWPKHHHKCQRACLCGHCSTRQIPLLNKHESHQQAVQPCSCTMRCSQRSSSTKADSRSRWQLEGNYVVQVDELDDGMESDTGAPDPALGNDNPGPSARETMKLQAQASSQQQMLHNPAVCIPVQSAAPVVASSLSRMTSVAQSSPLPANGTKPWRQNGKQHHLPSRLKQQPLAAGAKPAAVGTKSPGGSSSTPATGTKRHMPAADPRGHSACRLAATGSPGTHGTRPSHRSASATEALTGKPAPAATGEVLFTKVLSLTECQASCYSFYPPKPDFLEAFPKFANLRDGALKFCDVEGEQYEARVKMVRHKVGAKAGNLNIVSISYGKAFKLKHKLTLGAELVFVRRRGKLVVEVRHGRQHGVNSPLSRSAVRLASRAEPRAEHAGAHTAEPVACTAVPHLAAAATTATMAVPVTLKPELAASTAAAPPAAAAAAAAAPELAAGAATAAPLTAAAAAELAAGTAAAAPAAAAAVAAVSGQAAGMAAPVTAEPAPAAGTAAAAPATHATVSRQAAGIAVAELTAAMVAATPDAGLSATQTAAMSAVGEADAGISTAQPTATSVVGEAAAGRGAQESAAGAAAAEPEADVATPQQAAGAAVERLAADAATVNVAQATVASTAAAQLPADSAATAGTAARAATLSCMHVQHVSQQLLAPASEDDEDELPLGQLAMTCTIDAAAEGAVQCKAAVLGKRAAPAPLPVSVKRRSPAASPAAPLSTKVKLMALPLACVQQAAAPLVTDEPHSPSEGPACSQQLPPLPTTSKASRVRTTQPEASMPGRTSKWLKVTAEPPTRAETIPPSSAGDAGKRLHPTSSAKPAAAPSACADTLRTCPQCKCDIAGPASVMECDDGTVLHVCQRCYRRHYMKNYRLGIKLGRQKGSNEDAPQARQPLPPPHKKPSCGAPVSGNSRSADNSTSSTNPRMVPAKSMGEDLVNGIRHAPSTASSGAVSAPANGVETHATTTTTLHGAAEMVVKLPAVATGGAQPSVAVKGIPGHQHEWTRIDRNKYVGRQERPWGGDQVPVCDCDPAKGDTCGTECVNRMLLIECTPGYCRCGDACSNQAIARRQSPALSIRHFSGKGAGLTADEPIAAGHFVLEYIGEVVTTQEAKRRAADYSARGFRHQYVMSLSSNEVIDATVKGGLARFVNHSCQPNCATQKWEVRGELRVAIVALRDISAGEELTYDYNFDWHGGPPTACLCGAPGCVLWLGARSRGFKLQGDLEEPATDGLMEADARLTWVPDDDGTLRALDSHLDDFGDE